MWRIKSLRVTCFADLVGCRLVVGIGAHLQFRAGYFVATMELGLAQYILDDLVCWRRGGGLGLGDRKCSSTPLKSKVIVRKVATILSRNSPSCFVDGDAVADGHPAESVLWKRAHAGASALYRHLCRSVLGAPRARV